MRLAAYKTIAFVRQCRNTTAPMLSKSSTQNLTATFNRWRRLTLLLILVGIIILYAWPSWLMPTSLHYSAQPMGALDLCVDSKLSTFQGSASKFDVLQSPGTKSRAEQTYLPFVGNGHIGTAVESSSNLFLKYGRTLSIPVNFYPVLNLNAEGLPSSEASVIDLRAGIVHKIQCFELGKLCVSATSHVFAHRARPALLIQETRIENPTEHPVTLIVEQSGISGWTDITTESKKFTSNKGEEVEYTVSVGTVPIPESTQGLVFIVGIASIKLPESISVAPSEPTGLRTITSVRFTDQPQSASAIGADKEEIAKRAENDLQEALSIDSKMLREEHTGVWTQLWRSGFGISRSRAEGALNGDQINATIYYVLSHMPSPIHEVGVSSERKLELQKSLYYPDRCYDGHHTIQNDQMWERSDTMEKLGSVVKMWIMTLEKKGCTRMLRAGADGILQAMILSFGGFKFSHDHLEFWTQAKDLHRDYFFRRINYGNNTHVNISVIVGDDNKPVLYVALDRNDKPYYACDGGCIDPSVKLSREQSQFPVKKTDPETPIIYITADKQHMDDIKHITHVREVVIAPAHEHRVIALHRHGHHYGGLPVLFWISVGFLIAIFHLFLFKLVYNEYCQSAPTPYTRTRYSV